MVRTSRLGLILLIALGALSYLSAQQANTPPDNQGWLANKTDLIAPGDLPRHLEVHLQYSGGRMMSADKALLALTGTVTDDKGARPAQILIQAPGYLSYREGNGHSVVFNGNGFQGNAGPPGQSDESVMESLLAHFPDTVCLQVATGGNLRRLGSHFRPDGSKAANYSGPFWTILAFSPQPRNGLAKGKALQQELFIALDESTGLMAEVRTVNGTGTKQQVVQTQFTAWTHQGDQWYPGRITRLENGKQTLAFQLQQASVGAAGAVTAFVP
jgi:hypothetical protein